MDVPDQKVVRSLIVVRKEISQENSGTPHGLVRESGKTQDRNVDEVNHCYCRWVG